MTEDKKDTVAENLLNRLEKGENLLRMIDRSLGIYGDAVNEHSEKAMESILFSCLALSSIKEDMSPLHSLIVERIVQQLKEGAAELAILRWLTTGKELNREDVETIVKRKLDEELRKVRAKRAEEELGESVRKSFSSEEQN